MRVMVDTNILISALIFPGQRTEALLCKIVTDYRLVLSSYVIDELFDVIRRKFQGKADAVDLLLTQLPYELVYAPQHPQPGLFAIRDENDYPVLYSAMVEDVDVFVTGDKDFADINLERPEILTPAQFLDKY